MVVFYMGYTVKINCPKCSLKQELNLGQGMSDYSLEHVISYLSDSDKQLITTLQNEGQIKLFEFNRYLSICTVCNLIDSTPVLDITLLSDEKMWFKKSCNTCAGNLRILKDSSVIKDIDCPNCNDAKLEISQVGYWD